MCWPISNLSFWMADKLQSSIAVKNVHGPDHREKATMYKCGVCRFGSGQCLVRNEQIVQKLGRTMPTARRSKEMLSQF